MSTPIENATTPRALLALARSRFGESTGEAHAAAVRALVLARAEGDTTAMIDALILLGECRQLLGEYAQSRAHLEAAAASARAAGDRSREANAHRLIAATHDFVGNFDLAVESHLAALKLHEDLDDPAGRANLMRTIGVCLSKSGSFEQAIEWYGQAHELATSAGEHEAALRARTNIAIDLKNLGRLEESLATYEESLELARRIGTSRAEHQVLANMANTYFLLDRIEDADRAFTRVLPTARELGAHQTMNCVVGLGRVRTRQGRFEEAKAFLDEGVAVGEKNRFRPDLGAAYEALTELYRTMGDDARALEQFEKFHRITRELLVDESQRRLKGVEMRMRIDQAQREASEQRQKSLELEEAIGRLQASAAEREARAVRLERQSFEDPLTGLPNLRHFEKQLAQAIADAPGHDLPLFVVRLAIDQLEVADGRDREALKEVARVLRASVDPVHMLANLGHGDFGVLLRGADAGAARAAGQRMCHAIEAHDWAAVHPWVKPRAAAGVADLRAAADAADVLSRARASLQASKVAGGYRLFAAAPLAEKPAESPAGQGELILGEQVRGAYANLPLTFGASLVASTLLCVVVRDVIPQRIWATWLVAMLTLSAGLLVLHRCYQQRKPLGAAARRWGHFVTLGSLAAGCLWGAGTVVLHTPDSIDYQILIAVTAAIVASSAAFASATYLPPFFAFLFPAVVPTIVLFLDKSDTTRIVTGLLLVFFLPVVTRFATAVNRAFIESLRLRFQNIALVGELRDKKEAAEGASVAKSRFLAAASHDLRQPMHALGLFLQSLRRGQLAERERRLVENIDASYHAMEALFDALFDVSRLDAGVVEARVRTFAVNGLLDRLRTTYEPQAAAKGVAFLVRPCSAHVRSDPTLLTEMVGNLIANAVRHTRSGRIVVGCRRVAGRLRIEVWDTGAGIPKDKQREVFRDFVQLGNPERDRRQGLGLGLAIVDRLSRLLDHPVDLRSEQGRGCGFRIVVPLGHAHDAEADHPIEGELGTIETLEGKLVVVVDDDAAVLAAMSTLLASWGCEVAAADSGARILGKLATASRRPDLILCDYRLRDGESGPEVIGEIRAEFNDEIPAALITGDTDPERLKEARASGLPLLLKPVKAHRIRALMARMLARADKAAPI